GHDERRGRQSGTRAAGGARRAVPSRCRNAHRGQHHRAGPAGDPGPGGGSCGCRLRGDRGARDRRRRDPGRCHRRARSFRRSSCRGRRAHPRDRTRDRQHPLRHAVRRKRVRDDGQLRARQAPGL
ncbi:MAG: hypothetical protein AVDCRST_MAG15-128, partial [uncultured Rubellimicrobium sp.]